MPQILIRKYLQNCYWHNMTQLSWNNWAIWFIPLIFVHCAVNSWKLTLFERMWYRKQIFFLLLFFFPLQGRYPTENNIKLKTLQISMRVLQFHTAKFSFGFMDTLSTTQLCWCVYSFIFMQTVLISLEIIACAAGHPHMLWVAATIPACGGNPLV